jgi:Protein of unknown function (DUF3108)
MGFKARLAGALSASLLIGLAAAPARAQEPVHLSLRYDGDLFVKVLDVAIDQVLDGDHFSASAHIKTSGILALFRKLDLSAESQGRLENAVAEPKTFSYANIDGKKNRHVTAIWSGADVETLSQPVYPNMGDPPATREQRLEAADPLTVLTRLAVLPPGQKPCQGVSHFYDGKQRYDLEYTDEGAAPTDHRERKLGLTNEVHCKLVYREVAGFKRKPSSERNQGLRRDITVGIGRLGGDGPWVISFLRAETILGSAEINLVNARLTAPPRAEPNALVSTR